MKFVSDINFSNIYISIVGGGEATWICEAT